MAYRTPFAVKLVVSGEAACCAGRCYAQAALPSVPRAGICITAEQNADGSYTLAYGAGLTGCYSPA